MFEGYTGFRHIVPFKCLQFAEEKVASSAKNIHYLMERKAIARGKKQISKHVSFKQEWIQ
jgi:hypothetical protein